jgi:hypothetical protein
MKKYKYFKYDNISTKPPKPTLQIQGWKYIKMFIFWCCIIVFTKGMLRFRSTQLWYHDQMLEITQFFIIWNKKTTLQKKIK